jgi:L-lactate dehydrogenase complex protein LldG
MKDRSAKGEILARIRQALVNTTSQPYPSIDPQTRFFVESDEALEVRFAEAFTALNGNFVYCQDHNEFYDNLALLTEEQEWHHLFAWETQLQDFLIKRNFKKCRIGRSLDKADAGITLCEALVARTGSILLSSKQAAGRSLSLFPPIHIVVAYSSQLVPDIQEALDMIRKKYEGKLPTMISLASGPSRTADIEKTLVLGAHGPKSVYVFLIDNAEG